MARHAGGSFPFLLLPPSLLLLLAAFYRLNKVVTVAAGLWSLAGTCSYNLPLPHVPSLPSSQVFCSSSSDVTDSPSPASKREKEYLTERRELAVEFLFCLVLAEVLTRLSVHPVPESFIHNIEDLAFRHFKQQESIKDRWGWLL